MLAWAAMLVGVALAGCATSNGEEDEPQAPSTAASSKPKKDENPAPPAFEASIDAGDGGGADSTPSDDANKCLDEDDPGSAENVAKVLPDTDDCDNDYKEVSGVAKGAVDVDYFKVSASDRFGCSLDTDFEGETAGTELCVFARCKNSTIDAVSGCSAGTLTTSDIGMKGCCAAAPGRALPDWDCSGLTDDDSADFVLRVRQPGGNQCLPYKFRYRY